MENTELESKQNEKSIKKSKLRKKHTQLKTTTPSPKAEAYGTRMRSDTARMPVRCK